MISGTVRGPEGMSPIENREVAVINVDTGERQRATTNPAGGFSFKLKPGKYRVEIALLQAQRSSRSRASSSSIAATSMRMPTS